MTNKNIYPKAGFYKRAFCLLVFSVFAMLSNEAYAVTKKVKEGRPNIILILADDLGYNGLGCYGNDFVETPNIDKLCAQGMRFTAGYAAAPTCAPSRAAIMSGQYAPRTDVYRVKNHHAGKEEYMRYFMPEDALRLRLEKVTIAEALKAGGYATAMFGKWHLGYDPKNHPVNQGFDIAIESHGAHFNFKTTPKVDYPEGAYVGDFFTDKALGFIDDQEKKEKPFFLYMPYFLIHGPYEAKQEHLDYFKKKLPKSFPERYIYWSAMTKSLDENVGRIMNRLEELGIAENTLVIFASDNGGAPDKYPQNSFNQPLRMYKGETFEGGIRVPYIFRWPEKIKAGTVCNEPIQGIDLYPTCVDAAGLQPPKQYILDGLSLMSILTSDGSVRLNREALYWYYPKCAGYNAKTDTWKDTWRNVIRTKDYKLIEYIEYNKVELYNLKEDVSESNDLSTQMPEKVKELKDQLEKWKESIKAAKPIPNVNRKSH
ncbi:sulfatase [Labilibacter sediminis]|nr:sulfatase [Labilibacter sediminis]